MNRCPRRNEAVKRGPPATGALKPTEAKSRATWWARSRAGAIGLGSRGGQPAEFDSAQQVMREGKPQHDGSDFVEATDPELLQPAIAGDGIDAFHSGRPELCRCGGRRRCPCGVATPPLRGCPAFLHNLSVGNASPPSIWAFLIRLLTSRCVAIV